MTKEQIEETLRKHSVIKNSKSMLEYERAKRIMLSGPMCAREYDHRIRTIIEYLEI